MALVVDEPPRNGTLSFYTPANGGGLTILQGGLGSTVLVNNDGPGFEQLFTGSLTSPSLETFSNLQLVGVGAFSLYRLGLTVMTAPPTNRCCEHWERPAKKAGPRFARRGPGCEMLREQFSAITIVPVALTFKAWVLASFSGIEQDENGMDDHE